MLQRMEAEILFDDQAAADAASAVLATHGFTIERLPYVDEYEGVVLTPTVWVKIRTDSELDDSDFFQWVAGIIEPLQGWLYEAGYADPPSQAA
jgi:hypothetical protein